MKILQVVGNMNCGGAETWLMHVVRNIDAVTFQLDFLFEGHQKSYYEAELESIGIKIFRVPSPRKSLSRYILGFLRTIQLNGPYQIVHAHQNHFSGLVCALARIAGVTIRIAHSHSAPNLDQLRPGILKRKYYSFMKRLISANVTHGLACSQIAADWLFGADSKHISIIHNGIDLTAFCEVPNPTCFRDELGIPKDSYLIGHVGRFESPKNHSFLLDVFIRLKKLLPQAILILIGDGSLRASIEQTIQENSLKESVFLLGVRSDIARIFKTMDLFLFPSKYEGFPLAVVEAQTAGLPCLISDSITIQCDIIPGLVWRKSLSSGPDEWVEEILRIRETHLKLTNIDLRGLKGSPIDCVSSTRKLEELYKKLAQESLACGFSKT
jgi:glycosyltransferase involved in cell wall biosynthesis